MSYAVTFLEEILKKANIRFAFSLKSEDKMTLKEVQEKLQGKFEIKKFNYYQHYILKLDNGCVVGVMFKNGEFSLVNVEGGKRAEVEEALGIEREYRPCHNPRRPDRLKYSYIEKKHKNVK